MADFGAFVIADNGTLLVSPDSPCYEFVADYYPYDRSGNVNTYRVHTNVYPLIFVNCGQGQSAGILSIEGAPGNWTVKVLSSISCSIQAFVPLTSASLSGFGVAIFAADGRPVFDSNKKVLNVRDIGGLAEGYSFGVRSPSDMVSYTSGPIKPGVSVSSGWETAGTYSYETVQYACYPAGYNQYGSPIYSCGYQNVIINVAVQALVQTTTWTIERGVANISSNGASVGFRWLLHKAGFYKDILQYRAIGYSGSVLPNGLPNGYAIGQAFIAQATASSGEMTRSNTYPYTSSRANIGVLNCIAAKRSDYD